MHTATMATPGSDDDDDAFGSFDDGFGSFEDGSATESDPPPADSTNLDQPTRDVLEPTAAAKNSTDGDEVEAEDEGGSLPPSDAAATADDDVDTDARTNMVKDDGGGVSNGNDFDGPVAPSSDEPSAPLTDMLPEAEQQSDMPMTMSAPSPSAPSSPPELSSVEEAMELADEAVIAVPEASAAPLKECALPDGEAEAEVVANSSTSTIADADVTAGMGSSAAMVEVRTMSPPPLDAGEITDELADDPFASLGGAAEGFGILDGMVGDASGGDETPGGGGGGADIDASISAAESGPAETDAEATSTDVPIAEPQTVETPAAPADADDGGIDPLGAFPSEEADKAEESNSGGTNGTEADISSTEPPLVTSTNPPLDQLSSFVTAATEEDQNDDGGGDDYDENGDEDDFGGFEDAASEEEEKKDGSPIADKLPDISDVVDSAGTIPPALPLETEDTAPADSFGAFDDGAETEADAGDEQKVVVLEAVGTDENGGSAEATDRATFGTFGEPTPISDEFPDKAAQTQAKEDTEEYDDEEGDFGDFDVFAEAPPPSNPLDDARQDGAFDTPASASATALDESNLDGKEPKEEEEEEESDDDFGDFGDFGKASEVEEIPTPAEINGADASTESEVPESETAATAPEGGGGGGEEKEEDYDDDDDDDDDDFGDFGAFDEAAAPEPASAAPPISAPTAPKAEPTPADQGFSASFEEQAVPPTGQPMSAGSDPILQKATIVCKGMFQQYAASHSQEGQQEDNAIVSIPVQDILDSILAGDDSEPTFEPSSSLSSKEKIRKIFLETEIERDPATLIMNYDMPKPYAQYSADPGAHLKTDRGLSLEVPSHSNNGDVFVPEVLSIDLPKESELTPEPRATKSQMEPSAEFVDFPMSATRAEIPDKKEGNDDADGFANFGESSATPTEVAPPVVAEPASAVDKFLAKIPDLSFMLSKELVLPK